MDVTELRKLSRGMSREEVVSILGQPDQTGGFRRRRRLPGIYKYGAIELHFEPWKAGGLFLAYTEDEHLNGVDLSGWLGPKPDGQP